ncbi:DUF6484 domain-containing protein [Chitinimonas lacunae]|uniref:DUF6484 domain-containing protein n=1 Tax=Chitinimonas lacunae TaxID=1963018 RepID=A0ABV8MY90_9NEIS
MSDPQSRQASAGDTVTTDEAPLDELLARGTQLSGNVPARADGVAIGRLQQIGSDGRPRVSIPRFGLEQVSAMSLVPADPARLGEEVALGFEDADPLRPIILGYMLPALPQPEAAMPGLYADGERVVIEARGSVELRCGESALILTADGQILLRGSYITSHASVTQRIRGGSVQIN